MIKMNETKRYWDLLDWNKEELVNHLLDYYNHYKVLPKNIIDELIDIKNDVDILKEVE